jgi:hypothetical protein
MKKIFLIILSVVSCQLLVVSLVFAQSPTATGNTTPTPKATATPASTTPKDTQVEKIKDLVASRVAELKLVDKKGLVGYVKSTTNTQIVITDSHGKEIKIDIDELTKFTSPTDKETFGISDVKKGDLLSLIGLFNKQTERLLARFVEVASNIPQNIDGVVVAIDDDNFTIDVADAAGKVRKVNIETSTKTFVFEEGDTVKSGFSKIETGERIIVVGFDDKNEKDQINASRITRLADIELSPELKKAAAGSVKETTTPTVEPTDKP